MGNKKEEPELSLKLGRMNHMTGVLQSIAINCSGETGQEGKMGADCPLHKTMD